MILKTLAEATRKRVEAAKGEMSCAQIIDLATRMPLGKFEFEEALRCHEVSFICEVKKASPSKGIISEAFPYINIAREYEKAGAACISVLTEPEYFLGSNRYLSEIKKQVKIPVLRKDFTIDEYQLYEAKALGADAVLLICALLDKQTISRYLAICERLGLSALVEAHTSGEISGALEAGARIIGVNNRNLKTFEVDIKNCINLRSLVPSEVLFVAESGIKSPEDIKALKLAGVDAVLIGEALMSSGDITLALNRLKGGV